MSVVKYVSDWVSFASCVCVCVRVCVCVVMCICERNRGKILLLELNRNGRRIVLCAFLHENLPKSSG